MPLLARSSRKRLAQMTAALLLSLAVCGSSTTLSAQANNVNYTADYPSVDRVKAEIKGKDPTDTLARQMAVFTYLSTQIKRIKENRDYKGPFTPDELRLISAYDLAAYTIQQDYNKSHTPAEAKTFDMLQFNYVLDGAFRAQWTKVLIGPQGQNAYKGTLDDMNARQERHYNQEMQTYIDAQKKQQTAASGGSSTGSNDPTAVATRRCLELGGDQLACVGKGLGAGITGMIGVDTSDILGPGRAGVVLINQYSGSGAGLSFGNGSVAIDNCGKLVADGHSYTINKSPSALQIKIDNSAHPFVLTMRPDGGLTGPGPVDVSGRIIIGYHTVVSTLYVNGAPARCGVGICTSTSTVPDYAPKIERCTIGSYNPPPPPSPEKASSSQSGGLVGAMTGFLGNFVTIPKPGLRMVGTYTGSGGMILAFDLDAVTIDCGQAHVKQQYSVRNAAQILVDVQNSGAPFTIALQPDNSFRGSGSTTVSGRLVSGMQGNNVTYAPVSATCPVAAFTAKTGNTPDNHAAFSPGGPIAPSGASSQPGVIVRLAVLGRFPQEPNPLAGKQVFLMKNRFDTVLKNGGFSASANASPGKAMAQWVASCKSPTDACKAMLKTIGTDVVGRETFDGNGNATIIAQLPAGTYFVMVSAPATSAQMYLWDLPIALKSGNSSIVLDPGGAETIRTQ